MATFSPNFSTLSFQEKVSEPDLSKDVTGTDSEEESASNTDSEGSDDEGLLASEEDSGLDDIDSNEDDDEVDGDGATEVSSNPGWADAMAKILKTSKPKGKKSIVLSKAKKLNDVVRKDQAAGETFEVVGEIKDEKPDPSAIEVKPQADQKPTQPKIKRHEWYSQGRQKPNILDKDRERTLGKIGTKGVVQLFNAVRQQLRVIDSKLQDAGSGPSKRDKVLKTINKRALLDIVMGAADSQLVDNPVKLESERVRHKGVKKEEEEDDSKPVTWQVLRDDFLMGGKYKDWDLKDPKQSQVDEPMLEDSDSDSA